MNQILFPPVNEPMSQEEIEYRAMRRELQLISERTELEAARQRGYEEGYEEGLEIALNRIIASGIPETEAREWLNMQ